MPDKVEEPEAKPEILEVDTPHTLADGDTFNYSEVPESEGSQDFSEVPSPSDEAESSEFPDIPLFDDDDPVPAGAFEATDPAVLTQQTQERKNRRLGALLSVANAVCLLLLAVTVLLAFREEITVRVPPASGLYNAIGYYDTHYLKFADLVFSRNKSGESWRFGVKGLIANEGQDGMPTPTIRARLYSKEGELLEEWTMSSDKVLLAGERRAFNAKGLRTMAENGHILAVDIGSPVELMLRK